ncbi:PH domain-like protein [Astrocystis sublimbata]|nr:PH domain-like protein [Astrocystis sublimbata]
MSRSAPRRNQSNQSNNNNNNHAYPDNLHGHSHQPAPHPHGHGRQRSRQIQQQHQQLPTSDYESDTPQQHMAPQQAAPSAALAGRTNPELNLAVLRRYMPSITSVLSIAANAVVYTFEPPSQWQRTTMEGTMFICSQRKTPTSATDPDSESGCLFILNRKGLQNFVLDLDNVGDFELAGDLLIFKLDHASSELHLESGETVRPKVLGLWTYAEETSDRETNATLITDMWNQALSTREARARAAASHVANADPAAAVAALADAGPAAQATTGRKLSVSDLFSAYNGSTRAMQGS